MISSFIIKTKQQITLREYLKSCYLSNSYIYKLGVLNAISNDSGYILLDDELKDREVIYINFSMLEVNNLPLNINEKDTLKVIYEDDNIIGVYKKRGMLVHSDGSGIKTLFDDVSNYLLSKGDDSFIRPLHRLDVDTCGVVIFSKNVLSHAYISRMMEENKIEKEYRCYVEGAVNEDGFVDIGIGRDRHNSKKSIAIKSGKNAFTKYEVLKKYKDRTYLKVNIKTGRTHQIRVHMAYIKHPIIGDSLYGGRKDKLMLMCKKMSFVLFDKKINVCCSEEL